MEEAKPIGAVAEAPEGVFQQIEATEFDAGPLKDQEFLQMEADGVTDFRQQRQSRRNYLKPFRQHIDELPVDLHIEIPGR
jgi:hypothetical protein